MMSIKRKGRPLPICHHFVTRFVKDRLILHTDAKTEIGFFLGNCGTPTKVSIGLLRASSLM